MKRVNNNTKRKENDAIDVSNANYKNKRMKTNKHNDDDVQVVVEAAVSDTDINDNNNINNNNNNNDTLNINNNKKKKNKNNKINKKMHVTTQTLHSNWNNIRKSVELHAERTGCVGIVMMLHSEDTNAQSSSASIKSPIFISSTGANVTPKLVSDLVNSTDRLKNREAKLSLSIESDQNFDKKTLHLTLDILLQQELAKEKARLYAIHTNNYNRPARFDVLGIPKKFISNMSVDELHSSITSIYNARGVGWGNELKPHAPYFNPFPVGFPAQTSDKLKPLLSKIFRERRKQHCLISYPIGSENWKQLCSWITSSITNVRVIYRNLKSIQSNVVALSSTDPDDKWNTSFTSDSSYIILLDGDIKTWTSDQLRSIDEKLRNCVNDQYLFGGCMVIAYAENFQNNLNSSSGNNYLSAFHEIPSV